MLYKMLISCLFPVMPELIVSRLFCTDLENEECLVITGCERFSKYDGLCELRYYP